MSLPWRQRSFDSDNQVKSTESHDARHTHRTICIDRVVAQFLLLVPIESFQAVHRHRVIVVAHVVLRTINGTGNKVNDELILSRGTADPRLNVPLQVTREGTREVAILQIRIEPHRTGTRKKLRLGIVAQVELVASFRVDQAIVFRETHAHVGVLRKHLRHEEDREGNCDEN